MNKPYIKNKGTTTLISSIPGTDCPGNDNYNKIDWDIAYDGNLANIEMDVNSNGKSKHFNYELTNDDLADILNVPSFQMPLEERLMADFPLHEEEFIIAPREQESEIEFESMRPPASEEMLFSPPMQVQSSSRPKKIQIKVPRFEPLLQSLRVKKIKPRSRKFKPRQIGVSSLRRKLLTPRPKTMRIILKPKSSRQRTSSRR
jgi:hypothetical protein